MALKKTSEVITVSIEANQGVANTFSVQPVDLQLNPLDQEVFVVTGVKIDFLSAAPHVVAPAAGWNFAQHDCAITTTRPTSMPDLGNSSCLAYAQRQLIYYEDGAGAVSAISQNEQGPIDTPESNLDYIGIVATSDMFISFEGYGSTLPAQCRVRVYGYRARADAATYAALVQSEVLSS